MQCNKYLYNIAFRLLRLLIAVLGTSILLHIPSIVSLTIWRRVLDDHRMRYRI